MTKIEWTDATWNPIVGCSVVSPGCTNCYAMRMAGTRLKNNRDYRSLTQDSKAGPVWNGKVRFLEERLIQPLRWRKPRRVFVNSMGDLFHEAVSEDWLRPIWNVMQDAHQKHGHVFQVLTKRPERIAQMLGPRGIGWYAVEGPVPFPEPGIWLGTSVEDQKRADERIPHLLNAPAAVRFLSCEPLLGPLDLYNGDPDPRLKGHCATKTFLGEWWEPGAGRHDPPQYGVDWVICGGESGPGARDMDSDWARSLRDQCLAADVPYFMKQMARKSPIPVDLMVREFPA